MLLSGKTGFVLDSLGVSRSFNEWDLDIIVGRPKVTNWNSGGFQALVLGIYSGKITVRGPYDYGNMPFTAGFNTLTLGWLPNVGIVLSGVFDMKLGNKTEGNPDIALTGDTSGVFGLSVV